MNDQGQDFIRGAVEALLFISDRPVAVEQIVETLPGVSANGVRQIIQEIKDEYELKPRGMVILEIAGGFQMLSSPRYSDTIRTFFKTRVKERLSKPALETLAIIAYKQPVSRADVEVIRGVNSDGVVLHLLNRGLIKVVGRKEVPGRPFLYGTTKQFLEYFGLKSLSDLPKLEDFTTLFASTVSKDAAVATSTGELAASSASAEVKKEEVPVSVPVANESGEEVSASGETARTAETIQEEMAVVADPSLPAVGEDIFSVPSGASHVPEDIEGEPSTENKREPEGVFPADADKTGAKPVKDSPDDGMAAELNTVGHEKVA